MHAKTLVILLALPMAGIVACGGGDKSGVDAGGSEVSLAVDTKAIPDVPITDAPDAAVCDRLAAAARAQVESYLQSTSSLACQIDSDCSLIYPTHLSPRSMYCFFSCGGLAVSTADSDAVTTVTASACDEYFGAGCPAIYPPPCPMSFVVCDHGTCARDAGAGGPSGATDAGTAPDAGANGGNDTGLDAPAGAGDPLDGGVEVGTVQCSFPGISPALSCAGGEYCMAFGGGAVMDSGISYTCAPVPEACLADHSCACLCGTASSGSAGQCAVRGQQCICIANQGALTLLCSAP